VQGHKHLDYAGLLFAKAQAPSQTLRRACGRDRSPSSSLFDTAFVVSAAGSTPEKIPMCIPIRRYVTSDYVALRVDPVGLAGSCTRDINGNELPIAQNKTVLFSILTVVETDDVSLWVMPVTHVRVELGTSSVVKFPVCRKKPWVTPSLPR